MNLNIEFNQQKITMKKIFVISVLLLFSISKMVSGQPKQKWSISESSNFPKNVGSIINDTFSIRTKRSIKAIEYLYFNAISLNAIPLKVKD